MKVALKIEVIGLIWVFSSPQHSFVKYERKPPKSCPVTFSRWTWRRYLGSIKTTLSRYQRHHLRNWQLGWSSSPRPPRVAPGQPWSTAEKPKRGHFPNSGRGWQPPFITMCDIKSRMCFCSNHSLACRDSGAILWIQKSLRLSLSNHRNWMPY